MSYASNTSVSQERSKMEIERILTRYGAEQFVYGWDGDLMVVGFKMKNRMIQFKIGKPTEQNIGKVRKRYGESIQSRTAQKLEQAHRQRWRALALVIKAKLEAVESGITEFEQEFLAHIVLPNKQTVGEWAKNQIEEAYSSGKMPKLLSTGGD